MRIVFVLLGALNVLVRHPWHLFGRGRATYFPLERRLLSELEESLPNEEKEVLRSQLSEINCVERVHAPKTRIQLNKIQGIRYDLEREKKFTDPRSEYVIRKIDFCVDGKRVRSKFYVVDGNLFSVEFTANLRKLLQSGDIEIEEVHC